MFLSHRSAIPAAGRGSWLKSMGMKASDHPSVGHLVERLRLWVFSVGYQTAVVFQCFYSQPFFLGRTVFERLGCHSD